MLFVFHTWRAIPRLVGGCIGYKIGLPGKLAINLARGYGLKIYTKHNYNKAYITTPPYQTDGWPLSNKNKFSLQRFVMKAGIQF